MEQWKDIEEYEGLYQVSNLGRVKSLNYNHTGKERILKPTKDSSGYLHVRLYKNSIYKAYLVHRLVAQTFISNTDNLPEVNHKNEIKTDNRVENLEFCDRSYNMNYGTRPQVSSKTVYQYSIDGEFIKEWLSTKEIERQLGYYNTNISQCCNGKRKTAYGYKWAYNINMQNCT